MATLTRMLGESDEDFQRRADSWYRMVFNELTDNEVFRWPGHAAAQLATQAQTPRSGFKRIAPGDTFKWDTYTDAPD